MKDQSPFPLPAAPRSPWQRYALAAGFSALALALRWMLNEQLRGVQPFAFFYLAVAASAWFAGRGAAMLVCLAGLLSGVFFFIEPQFSFAVPNVVPMLVYLIVCGCFIGLVEHARQVTAAALETARHGRETEAMLRQQNALLVGLSESVPDGILILSQSGKVIYANRRFAEIWNMPAEVLAAGKDEIALHWAETQVADPAAFRAGVARAYHTPGQPVRTEVAMKDGRVLERFGAPVVDGTRHGWVWTFRDVTERLHAETRLRESEQQLRRVLDNLMSFVGIMTRDGTLIEANRAPLDAAGIAADEVIGRKFWDCYWWSYSPAAQAQLREAVERANRGEVVRYDVPVRMAGDSRMWIAFQIAPLRDSRGEITHLIPSGMDISDRKRAEARLRESEERFRALSNATFDALVLHENGVVVEVNQAFVELFGYQPEEIIGQSGLEMTFRPEDLPAIAARMRSGDERPYEAVIRRKDGSTFLAEIRAKNVTYQGRQVRVAAAHDITARRQAEAALRESEERFRAVADNIPQLAWMTRADGEILWFNRRWVDYTGMDVEQIRREGWQAVRHPDYPDEVSATWQHALATGEPWEHTFLIRRKDGEYRWFLSRAFPIRDAAGKILRWFGTNTDITQLRETEEALKHAHAELQRRARDLEGVVAERTAKLRETIHELEAFSYSLSHDMRAPLRAMKGFSQILEAEFGAQLGAEGNMYLRRISLAAGRLDQLIQDVLSYSRIAREKIHLQRIDVEKLAHQLIEENPALQPPQAEISIASPLHAVVGHEAYLMQALSNLVYNAIKFVAPGTPPRIRLWTEASDTDVRLYVQDNGIGIPGDAQPRLFRMFERVHNNPAYEGTGIGLSIVRKAVERMDGEVGVDSEPGRGSTFWIRLRRA